MLQCLADEKGPEEIKRLDALCQRDPRTQKEGHEALRVQFERTLAEGYEFHGIARGIPQARTPGQTVGPSPHVALVPALPGFEVGVDSPHEREYRKWLGFVPLWEVLGQKSKLAKLVLAYRGLGPPMRRPCQATVSSVFAVAAVDAQRVVSNKLQSIAALPSSSLNKSPPGAKRPRVDFNELFWSTDAKEKKIL